MKFRAHETFFIRKGWLSKGIKYVEQTDGRVFIDKEPLEHSVKTKKLMKEQWIAPISKEKEVSLS